MKVDSSISAVITGGASGLGAASARALAAKGAKVTIFDLQERRGRDVAAEIGGVFCEVNVTDDASVEAGFAKAREAHGQERILFNCAKPSDVDTLFGISNISWDRTGPPEPRLEVLL